MNKNAIRIGLAGCMCGVLVLPSIAHAETIDDATVTEDGLVAVQVNAVVDANFSVKVPKIVNLSNKDESSGGYIETALVEVSGDIPANKKVVVVPDAEVHLTEDTGVKDEVVASVSLDKSAYLYDEIIDAATGNVTITSGKISAGDWTGTFQFHISLEDLNDTHMIDLDEFGPDEIDGINEEIEEINVPTAGEEEVADEVEIQ